MNIKVNALLSAIKDETIVKRYAPQFPEFKLDPQGEVTIDGNTVTFSLVPSMTATDGVYGEDAMIVCQMFVKEGKEFIDPAHEFDRGGWAWFYEPDGRLCEITDSQFVPVVNGTLFGLTEHQAEQLTVALYDTTQH